MTIETCDFKGKKVIVRVDFNVPLDDNGNITDDTRIRGALPTLKKVLADGGSLIIMSHMGKPKGKVNPKFSLGQIVDAVSERLGVRYSSLLIVPRHRTLPQLSSPVKCSCSKTSACTLKRKASL